MKKKDELKLDKGEEFTISIISSCLCECTRKAPIKCSSASSFRGKYESTTIEKSHHCFYVYDLDDFVFFPIKNIELEKRKKKSKKGGQ